MARTQRFLDVILFPGKALILGSAFLTWVSFGTLIQSLLQTLKITSAPTIKLIDMRGKVCIVTGSNTGIGLRTATALVKCGATVIFACRSKHKAIEAIESVKAEAGTRNWATSAKLYFIELDLSYLQSVRSFVREIKERFTTLDVVVLNAGLNVGSQTKNGLDAQWQVNYLGHWLLISELLPLLKDASGPNNNGARVVCLSSVCHHFGSSHRFDWHCNPNIELSSKQIIEQNASVYSDSKLAMNLLACELQKIFNQSLNQQETTINNIETTIFHEKGSISQNNSMKISSSQQTSTRKFYIPKAISVNPGAVASDIWRGVPWFIRTFLFDPLMTLTFLNTDEGAATSIAASLNPLVSYDNEDNNNDAQNDDKDNLLKRSSCSSHQNITKLPTPYYSPYWVPNIFGWTFPIPFESFGPFMGAKLAPQTLPKNLSEEAHKLWILSEQTVKRIENNK